MAQKVVQGSKKTIKLHTPKAMQKHEISTAFKTHLQNIGYSNTTLYQVPYCINEFLTQVNKPIKHITQKDILDFNEYLQYRPLRRREGVISENGIRHYIYGLKLFFKWLEQTDQINTNPISNIKFKRILYVPRQPLTQKQIQQLFKAAENTQQTAILHLFYSCGLRRTEAVNLNTNDIHFGRNLLYVRKGKGLKRRVVPITEGVKKVFEKYLIHRYNPHKEEAFMLNSIGGRMSGEIYNQTLKEMIENTNSAQLGKEISLHHLRHSIATHLLENGMSIEFVRDFLGHSLLESTQIYTKVSKKMMSFK